MMSYRQVGVYSPVVVADPKPPILYDCSTKVQHFRLSTNETPVFINNRFLGVLRHLFPLCG